jgi:hypothetical protein
MSEKSTLSVMQDDIAGRLFPPMAPATSLGAPAPTHGRLDATQLRGVSSAGLLAVLLNLVAETQGRAPDQVLADPLATDGTPTLDSMTAVFLTAEVGAALGRQPLVRLSSVDPARFRSLGSLADLLHRAIAGASASRGAA